MNQDDVHGYMPKNTQSINHYKNEPKQLRLLGWFIARTDF